MRLEVTRKADLAVRALQVLEESGARMKAGPLADALATTPSFVPQVMGPMVKRSWVRSDPGPSGGYSLVVLPADISVLDVVELIDGPTDLGKCVVADRGCGIEDPCAMHLPWSRARSELMHSLSEISIADLRRNR